MKRYICIIGIIILSLLAGARVYAADSGATGNGNSGGGNKEGNLEDTRIGRKVKSYTEALEDMFDVELKTELEEEDLGHIRKTYMRLYKQSFDGFLINLKERFSLVIAKFEEETKGTGIIMVIAFLITAFVQGMNNKVFVGRNQEKYRGKIMARYRYDDGHLEESGLVAKIVRFAMVLEGLMLVSIVFKSDGVLFKQLFKLSFNETLWRVVAYGCIRLLISFLIMFIPFILAYLIALPIAVIKDYFSENTYERGPTFHAMALSMLEHKVILGILGVVAGVMFILVNYVSWFIYLEAAGMFK